VTFTRAVLEIALSDGVALCQKWLDAHGLNRGLKPEESCKCTLGRQKKEGNEIFQ
jgi:hypothetical protein